MKRDAIVCVLVLLVLVCNGAIGLAQRADRAGGVPNGALRMALNEAVQKELALSEDQVARLAKAAAEIRAPSGGARPDFRSMSDDERTKAFSAALTRKNLTTPEADAKAAEILLPRQVERLEQIGLQMLLKVRGWPVVADAEVAARLGLVDKLTLTAEQRTQIGAVQEESRSKSRAVLLSGQREGAREKLAALRKQCDQAVQALLTPAQKSAIEKALGKEFPLPESGQL